MRRGSAILSASAVVIQWSGRWFLVGSWQCSGIWGRLVTATRTVVRRPVGGWFLRPNGAQNGSKMGPKWLPGGLLERLGILKASWRRLGGLLGRPGRPLGRSWAGLGGILERSWACLGRSWAGLGGILRAKRLPEEAQEAPKSSPRGDSSSKRDFFKKCVFFFSIIH